MTILLLPCPRSRDRGLFYVSNDGIRLKDAIVQRNYVNNSKRSPYKVA
ncbi:MAG: hypothetical protein KME45_16375 [Stenomitos rutilans HA7619-LM2]|nr:hypothetical protein [Stenomitos rutilans HA7619-LM2]